MSDPVRWGILGAAKFAREHMGPAIHAAQFGSLSALATSDASKAAPFRAFASELRVHLDYNALLDDPEIDAIYIPLPNHMHVEWAEKAARAGKAVLCEKPIALAASEIDRLIALRDASGHLIAEAFMIVHHPQWLKARELIAAGEIGTLIDTQVRFSFCNEDMGNIRNKPETGGGGLPDIGVYAFGSVRFATGAEPDEIIAADITWENEVDTRAQVLARFPGFSYSGMVSTRMAPFQEVLFHGSTGVLRLSAPFNAGVYGEAEVILRKADGQSRIWRYPAANQYVLQVEAFNNTLRDGTDYPCPLEFSRGTQRMIDMVYAKARA